MEIESKFQKIIGNPELFQETLNLADPLFYAEYKMEEANLARLRSEHFQQRTRVTNDALENQKDKFQLLEKKAESIILAHSMRLDPLDNETFDLILNDGNSEELNLETADENQQIYLQVATALRSGCKGVSEIASHCNLRPYLVAQCLTSQAFREALPVFFAETGDNQGEEAKLLSGLQNSIEKIVFERSMSAFSEIEVNDAELISLGLSPYIRDAGLSAIPGSKTGFVISEPVTVMEQTATGVKKITQFVARIDHETINSLMKIGKRLTELDDSGKGRAQTTVNAYVRTISASEAIVE